MVSFVSETESVTIKESVENSDYGEIAPRISRAATLDGGAVLSTHGCSHSDRTVVISAVNVPVSEESALRRMAIQCLVVQMSNYEGVFTGAISQFSARAGKVDLTFLVKEKLTQD